VNKLERKNSRAFGLFTAVTNVVENITNVQYDSDNKQITLNRLKNKDENENGIDDDLEFVDLNSDGIDDKFNTTKVNVKFDVATEQISYVGNVATTESFGIKADGTFGAQKAAADENVRTIKFDTESVVFIYITGANVASFDTIDNSSYTSDFIVFGNFT